MTDRGVLTALVAVVNDVARGLALLERHVQRASTRSAVMRSPMYRSGLQ